MRGMIRGDRVPVDWVEQQEMRGMVRLPGTVRFAAQKRTLRISTLRCGRILDFFWDFAKLDRRQNQPHDYHLQTDRAR
jgi:hypothetical protein